MPSMKNTEPVESPMPSRPEQTVAEYNASLPRMTEAERKEMLAEMLSNLHRNALAS